MGMWKEFREFAVKGNMVDLAVGIIIGGAFSKVVNSIVSDILMPPLGYLIGGINFTDIKIHLKVPDIHKAVQTAKEAVNDPKTLQNIDQAVQSVKEVTINLGNFLQTLVDFTIMAFVVFLMVKAINSMHRKVAEAPAAPPEPTKQEVLLTEIRDLLKKK